MSSGAYLSIVLESVKPSKRSIAILLGAIVAAGAGLRLYGLSEQGFFGFDEVRYLIEAQKLLASLNFSPGLSGPILGMARPGHVMALAVLGCVTSGLYFMALLGTLTILIVAALGRETLRENAIGYAPALAALIIAASPAHVFFSRSLLAEVDAVFFLGLGIWIRFRAFNSPGRLSPSRSVYIFGVFLGLALAFQSRVALLLPFFLGAELLQKRLRPVFCLLIGIATPILAVETFYLLLKTAHLHNGSSGYVQSWFEQFSGRAEADHARLGLNRPFFGIEYLTLVESFVVTLLFAGSTFSLWRERNWKGLYLVGFVVWVLVVASLTDQVNHTGRRWGRMVLPAIPFVAVVVGYGLNVLWERARYGRMLVIGLIAGILVQRAEMLYELATMRSDQEEIMVEAFHRAPAARVFSDEPLHAAYYLEPLGAKVEFKPGGETMTVIILDPGYAKNFGFYYTLPDTPTFTIPDRNARFSRLLALENVGNLPAMEALSEPRRVTPAEIYVIPPARTGF